MVGVMVDNYTEDQIKFHEVLISVLTAGVSVVSICDTFSVSKPTVERWKTKVNLPHTAMCRGGVVYLLGLLNKEIEK